MKKLILSFVVCLSFLTGCGFLEKKNPPTINEKITVAPELLLGCPKLEKLSMPDPQYEDVATAYITTISLYGQCALKQEASVKAIKKLANIEGTK